MNFKRAFLFRRRIDRLVLIGGAAGLPFRNGISPLVAILFAIIGAYLAAVRHRSKRAVPSLFFLLAVGYLAWTVFLIAFRGDPFIDNRQLGYSFLIGLLAFIGIGMVLVRDPRDMFIFGSRIGIVLAVVVTIVIGIIGNARFGMGGNPAPWSLIVSICAVAAMMPMKSAPSWAPNSSLYLLAGILAVAASETRAVLAPLLLIVLVEAARWLSNKSWTVRATAAVAGFAALVALSFIDPFYSVLQGRIVPAIQFALGNAPEWGGGDSDTIRLYMWLGALKAFLQSPLIGLGVERMDAVVLLAPAMNEAIAQYQHVHNIFLDELISQGLIGFALLFGALWTAVVHLYRRNADTSVRLNIAYVTVTVLSYGMVHNPMLHETTIAAIFLYIGVLMAQTSRDRMSAAYKITPSPVAG
ncbi:O-antigen ligase family protein [Aliihoeflea sp. PC F10.4]